MRYCTSRRGGLCVPTNNAGLSSLIASLDSRQHFRFGTGCAAEGWREGFSCRLAASMQNTVPNFVPTLVQHWYQMLAKASGRNCMNPRINTGDL